MTDETAADLDYEVIVVRWDNEKGRTVVDLGRVEMNAAVTMLQSAMDAVYDEIESALVVVDGQVEGGDA